MKLEDLRVDAVVNGLGVGESATVMRTDALGEHARQVLYMTASGAVGERMVNRPENF